VSLANVGAGQQDFDAQSPQVIDFLLAHLVGDNERQVIAFHPCGQSQAKTGISGRSLDNGVAGLDLAFPFGFINHGQTYPVLNGTTRILDFEFYEQTAKTRIGMRKFDDGCVANGLENVPVYHIRVF
jgi:hypothetical protein